MYEPGRHQASASTIVVDPGVVALSFCAFSLGYLGWLDRARARAGDAVALAHDLRDPYTLAYALFYETVVHTVRGDVTAQGEGAREVIALSEANGFPLFLGLGRTLYAMARVAAGEQAAIADVLTGLGLSATTGLQQGAPGILGLLAEAHLAAGQRDDASSAVQAGLAVATQTGQPYCDAYLHRLQGEIVLNGVVGQESSAENRRAAEAYFHRALDIARAQEARLLELQTAISLARLWKRQGKRVAARELLAPVYAWFTEGFDTRDLQDAKALLDDLA